MDLFIGKKKLNSDNGYHSVVELCVKVKVTQSCPTLCEPMDSTVHGILQARILEWVAFPFSRGIFPTQVSHTVGRLFTEPQGKSKSTGVGSLSLLQWIFLTQESNWGVLHCRRILYQLSYQGSPRIMCNLYEMSVNFLHDPVFFKKFTKDIHDHKQYYFKLHKLIPIFHKF